MSNTILNVRFKSLKYNTNFEIQQHDVVLNGILYYALMQFDIKTEI